MDTLLNNSLFYISLNQYEIAYKYAYQLNEITYSFENTIVIVK